MLKPKSELLFRENIPLWIFSSTALPVKYCSKHGQRRSPRRIPACVQTALPCKTMGTASGFAAPWSPCAPQTSAPSPDVLPHPQMCCPIPRCAAPGSWPRSAPAGGHRIIGVCPWQSSTVIWFNWLHPLSFLPLVLRSICNSPVLSLNLDYYVLMTFAC